MNVEELLKEKGLSKAAFADMIGAKRQNINSLLKNPTLESIEKFPQFNEQLSLMQSDGLESFIANSQACGTKIEFKKKAEEYE